MSRPKWAAHNMLHQYNVCLYLQVMFVYTVHQLNNNMEVRYLIDAAGIDNEIYRQYSKYWQNNDHS